MSFRVEQQGVIEEDEMSGAVLLGKELDFINDKSGTSLSELPGDFP
jgi:hypothetical protein